MPDEPTTTTTPVADENEVKRGEMLGGGVNEVQMVDGGTTDAQQTGEVKEAAKVEVDLTLAPDDSDAVISVLFPDPVDGYSKELEEEEDDYCRKVLSSNLWYHGIMFATVADKLLKVENSFLVRRVIQPSTHRMLCVSLRSDKLLFNYRLQKKARGWQCEGLFARFNIKTKSFNSVHAMFDYLSLRISQIVPIPRSKTIMWPHSLTSGKKLGNGAFGEVIKALLISRQGPKTVAVKRIIGNAKRSQIREFCHEASVLMMFNHDNIVRIYGFVALEMPVQLIMELVPGGDLKKYVQTEASSISNRQMVSFAVDIARGMDHVASQKIIHRDLAARNCLISKSLVVKISDFGLAVMGETKVKSLKKAPIRWLAPETLQEGVFNELTDVWSYGVLLTELLNRCDNDPLFPRDLKACQTWIKENEHPHRVTKSLEPKELIEVVDLCCEKDVTKRKTFSAVRIRLIEIYDKGEANGWKRMKSPEKQKDKINGSKRANCKSPEQEKKTGSKQAKSPEPEKKTGSKRAKSPENEKKTGSKRSPNAGTLKEKKSDEKHKSKSPEKGTLREKKNASKQGKSPDAPTLRDKKTPSKMAKSPDAPTLKDKKTPSKMAKSPDAATLKEKKTPSKMAKSPDVATLKEKKTPSKMVKSPDAPTLKEKKTPSKMAKSPDAPTPNDKKTPSKMAKSPDAPTLKDKKPPSKMAKSVDAPSLKEKKILSKMAQSHDAGTLYEKKSVYASEKEKKSKMAAKDTSKMDKESAKKPPSNRGSARRKGAKPSGSAAKTPPAEKNN